MVIGWEILQVIPHSSYLASTDCHLFQELNNSFNEKDDVKTAIYFQTSGLSIYILPENGNRA